MSELLEQHMFISSRKVRDVFRNVFDNLFRFDLSNISADFSDRPSENFSSVNERTKKILLSIDKPEKIESISGDFVYGGSFKLQNGNLSIYVTEDAYNYDLLQALKSFLSPVFPIWIFRNQYIWGANLFENYERQIFFDERKFSIRAKLLDEPELDIYRRDNGIIHKYRFFTKEDFEHEEGIRFLVPYFKLMLAGLAKKNYEGLEVLHSYCTNKRDFRRFEPRTKLGIEIKSVLSID